MGNRVEMAYTAWPDRLYLIGKNGQIAWKGRPGAVGFVPAELAVAIEATLER
jgi:Iodothyronine deiodinase